MRLNVVSTNSKNETDGVWVDFPLDESIRFRIARDGNKQAVKYAADLSKREYRKIKLHDLDKMRDFENKILANSIIKDWEGLVDETTNEEFPYSKENAMTLLEMPELHDLREWIITQSKTMTHFLKEEVEEDVEQAKKS